MKSMNNGDTNIGIDTGQATLDIYARPSGETLMVENNPGGILQAIRFIKQFKPARVLIEATGRLEMEFFCAAHKAGLPACVCNPIQVRKFAQATGRLAKTDQLDAQDIAYYGETIKPVPTELKPARLRLLSDLLAVRSQCLEMSTMQKNRLQRMPKRSINSFAISSIRSLKKSTALINSSTDSSLKSRISRNASINSPVQRASAK